MKPSGQLVCRNSGVPIPNSLDYIISLGSLDLTAQALILISFITLDWWVAMNLQLFLRWRDDSGAQIL